MSFTTIVHVQDPRPAVGKGSAKALVTNGAGGYGLFGRVPDSRYDGFFVFSKGKMMRVLEHVSLFEQCDTLTVKGRSATASGTDAFVSTWMSGDALVLSSLSGPVKLYFDIKESYDDREFGRNYTIYEENHCIIIEFRKTADYRDENTGKPDYVFFAALYADELKYRAIKEWVCRKYTKDEQRRSGSGKRYSYLAMEVDVAKCSIGAAWSKPEAIAQAKAAFRSSPPKSYPVEYASGLGDPLRHAYVACANQLAGLMVDKELFAGLPWFFQYWSRDALISAYGLMLANKIDFVKELLCSQIEALDTSDACPGRLSAFPGSQLCSADGAGWLARRISDYCDLFDGTPFEFTSSEKSRMLSVLKRHVQELLTSHSDDGFVIAGYKQTWMDTTFASDDRQGACVEIQALTLATFRLIARLEGRTDPREVELRDRVRSLFDGQKLWDTRSDSTQRPNVFIAAYVYPQLFTNHEWEQIFDSALHDLWLDWGGLSSISKSHSLFTKQYTGETLQSYHRGDSWFWLNNIAAIVLLRVNRKKYKATAQKIRDASVDELLFRGAAGHHAEVSSADLLESQGCLSQAWSAATLLELLEMLKDRHSNSF